MIRDYITGEFKKDYERTVELLKDRNVKRDAKYDLVNDFCEYYDMFDSSKFDKYFID